MKIATLFLFLHVGCGWFSSESPVTGEPATIQETSSPKPSGPPLRFGYFHGGRNMLVYRAWIDNWFDKEGVSIRLMATKIATSREFHEMPKSVEELNRVKATASAREFGRTTGPTILGALKAKELDCGMIGESTFILAIEQGLPMTAITKLGQDDAKTPGKIVVVRSDLDIQSPQDLIGKNIGSRESGPYDMVMTREWILGQGLELQQMRIKDQIPNRKLKEMLKKKKLDLAFLHLHIAAKSVRAGRYKPYPNFNFDFANPQLSQALLVCRNEVLQERREELTQFISIYKKRIDFEQSLTKAQRLTHDGDKTLGMDMSFFKGLNIPQYDPIPLIDVSILKEMQGLILKHGIISKAPDITAHVDNSLTEEALKRVAAQKQSPQ